MTNQWQARKKYIEESLQQRWMGDDGKVTVTQERDGHQSFVGATAGGEGFGTIRALNTTRLAHDDKNNDETMVKQ